MLVVVAAAGILAAGLVAASGSSPARPGTQVHGLSAAEHGELAAHQAFTSHPVRFLLLGDSIALTLGIGLSETSVKRYGVTETNQGKLGCDLDDVPVRLSGKVGPATPGCIGWRTTWPQDVARYRPDVVGLLIGRWEVSDHLFEGKWVHIGQKVWDEHLMGEMDQAISMFSADGAKVVLFTMPYVDPPTRRPDGEPYAENTASRARAFNVLVDHVAAQWPHRVTVINLNALVDPSGHFQRVVDGVVVRWSDGVHITVAGGDWLQPSILPTVARLGLAAAPAVSGRRG